MSLTSLRTLLRCFKEARAWKKNVIAIGSEFRYEMTDNSYKPTVNRRVYLWRLLFGLAAGALLSAAWQLSTSSPGVEQESSFYRYVLANWLQRTVLVPEVYLVDSESACFSSLECARKGDFRQFLNVVVPALEKRHPAAVGIMLDSATSPTDISAAFVRFKDNIIVGVDGRTPTSSRFQLGDINFPAEKGQLTYKMPGANNKDQLAPNIPPFSQSLVLLYDQSNNLPVNRLIVSPPGRYLTLNILHKFAPEGTADNPTVDRGNVVFPNLERKVVLIAARSKVSYVSVPSRVISQLDLQAQAIGSYLRFDAYVDTRYRSFELWMLPVSLLLATGFSLLKPMPRFIAWTVSCISCIALCQYFFDAQHLITIFGTVMLMIHCCYLCGTIIFLETETVERKRALALAIQERAECERKRVAQELHDDVLPTLSRIMRMVDRQQEELPDSKLPGEIREKLESVVDSTRRIINDLHPAILENLGLVPAIEHLVMRFNAECGVEASVTNSTDKDDFAFLPSTKLCVYRMVQEALNNIEKHAEAMHVVVSVFAKDSLLTISIADDGKGILKSNGRPDSAGLLNITQRAELIGAKVQWRKSEQFGTGTELSIALAIASEPRESTAALSKGPDG